LASAFALKSKGFAHAVIVASRLSIFSEIQYERQPCRLIEIQLRRGRLAEAESAMRRGLGDRDGALIEMERVNAVDGRQLGLAPI
jgi:hypothetical protein